MGTAVATPPSVHPGMSTSEDDPDYLLMSLWPWFIFVLIMCFMLRP